MTVTVTSIIEGPLDANGVTTTFGFPFKVMSAEELRVYQGAIGDWTQVNDALYSVTLNSGEGGQVVFTTAPTGSPLYIASTPSFEQQGGFAGGEVPFTPVAVGALLDQAAIRALVLKDGVERSLKVPLGEEAPILGSFADAEGKVAGIVDGKMVPVPNGAADFAQAVADAKGEIGEQVEQVEQAAETVATQTLEVATNTGIASGAAVQAQNAALATASALAIAQALVAAGNFYIAPMIADAIAAAEADGDLADGDTFGVSGDDVAYWELRERDGSSSNLFWPFPKAIMPGAEIRRITYDRALTLADLAVAPDPPPIQVAFDVPAGMWGSVTIPSNSVTPVPAGAIFPFILRNGNPMRLVSDGVDGDVNIRPLIPGMTALVDIGARAWLMKDDSGPNDWLWFGELSPPPASAYSVKIFLDPSDLSSMRQERTGAAATTPVGVGDPIGSWRNKGSAGGWATARADSRRPILRKTGAFYWIESDGTDDFLELRGLVLDVAKLNLYVAFKPLSYQYGDGIVAINLDSDASLNNDAGFNIQHNTLNPFIADFAVNTGSASTPATYQSVGVQGVCSRNPRVWEWRKNGNANPAKLVIDGMLIEHTGQPTSLSALGKTTALISATCRLIIGANAGNTGQQGAIQHSHTGYYGVAGGDEGLTDAQRAAVRVYFEGKSYVPPPVFPAIADLTQLEAARTTLVTEISGSATLPTDLATAAIDVSPPPGTTGLTNLAKVEKLTIPGEADPLIKPRLFTPNNERTDVVAIGWPGHGGRLIENGMRDRAVQPLLTAGVPTALCFLPDGPNDSTAGSPTAHAANNTPYIEWVRQFVVTANLLLSRYPGAKLLVWGISGGGWATQLCAAVDPRVTSAVQFVGSMPVDFIYVNVDREQLLQQISADYLTLYLLGAAGGGGDRRHIQVLHEGDEAGFNRYAYSSRPPYAPGLSTQAAALGGYFELRWFDHALHTLYEDSTATLLAELP